MLPLTTSVATSTTRSLSSSPASRSPTTSGTGSPILLRQLLSLRLTQNHAHTTHPPLATPSLLPVTLLTSPTFFAQFLSSQQLHRLHSTLTTRQPPSVLLPSHSTRPQPMLPASTPSSTRPSVCSVPFSLASPFSRTLTTA